MAINNLSNYKSADGFGMSLNIRRGNPNPLDNSSLWASKAEAENYAETSAVAYVGQILSVIEGDTVEVYKIANESGQLVKLGEAGSLDAVNETISGISEKVTANEEAIGSLDEKVTSNEESIGTLSDDVSDLKGTVGDDKSGLVKAVSDNTSSIASIIENIADINSAGYATTDEVATAKQEAIDAAVKAILTDGSATDEINDAYDTIKEIAEWIASDETASTQIVNRVKAIEDDYLKGADKTELSEDITELRNYIGELPEGAASSTVVAYINEAIDALAIGDYAKASALTELAGKVTTLEGKVGNLESTTSETSTKVNEIAAFLGNPSTGDTLAALLENKVDKVAGSRLINQDEIDKLAKLSITDGELGISGTVSAGQVTGLPEAVREIFEATSDEDNTNDQLAKVINTTHLSDDLVELINNPVRKVKAGDEDAVVVTDQTLKFSEEFTVAEEKVTVSAINVSKLTQTEGEWLVLNGGNSSLDWE